MKKLLKKIKITATLELLSGLHIGGNGDNVEIGGIDNPVIKMPTKDNQPYIPGSSLKGKMRCLLEQIHGSTDVGGNEIINNLFGCSRTNQPSKIIVRDAYMTEQSVITLRNNDNLDMPYTEGKWENVISRTKGTAEHPRQTERIPAGVEFATEFIINLWDDDEPQQLLDLFNEGIHALENDYLGGSGSRGYGQIKFGPLTFEDITFGNE
ncbi:MAG: type III-A CRISPR-associated RAMP protein Csm3 [Anaerovoracaceae bacterium]